MKTSFVHMKFHVGCISKGPNILIDMCKHFISGSVYMIFYHPKWNFISVKVTDVKSIPALCFNAISNESVLIHFVSGKLCSHENSSRFEISFRSKWPIWNPYHFGFHFAWIHVNTSKELTEHWGEIFNRNEISYRFEFISPLKYSYNTVEKFTN